MNFYQRMGILPLKKRVNRDKCSFTTKQRMFGVFAIDEILRYRWTWFVSSRTLCHPGRGHPVLLQQMSFEGRNKSSFSLFEGKTLSRFQKFCGPPGNSQKRYLLLQNLPAKIDSFDCLSIYLFLHLFCSFWSASSSTVFVKLTDSRKPSRWWGKNFHFLTCLIFNEFQ